MKTNQIAVGALFVALIAVLSQLSFQVGPIPFTLGIMGVYFCAMLLNPKQAVLTVCAYLLLGAVGLPVFSGFKGGLQSVLGMTGGYLVGYILIAYFTAVSVQKFRGTTPSQKMAGILSASVLGLIACYTLGTIWFMVLSGNSLPAALAACVLPFVPADLIKIALAYSLAGVLKTRLAHAGINLSE